MAEVMTSVLDEIGPDRFLGVVTDNASNMKKAWEELKNSILIYRAMVALHMDFNFC